MGTVTRIGSRPYLALFFLLVIFSATLFSAPVPQGIPKARLDYFPSLTNTKWVYKHIQNKDYTVTDVVTKVVETTESRTIYVGSVDINGITEHTQTMRLTPSGLYQVIPARNGCDEYTTCFLKLPPKVGDEWECLVDGTTGTARTESIEEVEVPAGRFEAVKVVVRWKTANIAGGEAAGWFAPGVGAVKWQFTHDSAVVLHSFSSP